MASVTRLPGGRVTTPGLLTAPMTWTTMLPDVALKPPGPASDPVVGAVAGLMAGAVAVPVGGDPIAVEAPAAAGAAWLPAPVETSTALRARARARMRRAEPAMIAARGAIARRRGRRTGSSGSVEQARRTRSSRDLCASLRLAPMSSTVGTGPMGRMVRPSALWRAVAPGGLWQPSRVVGPGSVGPQVRGDGDAEGAGAHVGARRLVDREGEDLGDLGSCLLHGLAQTGLE